MHSLLFTNCDLTCGPEPLEIQKKGTLPRAYSGLDARLRVVYLLSDLMLPIAL